MTTEDRRVTDEVTPLGDTARILAILYTIGFFLIVLSLMWRGIPPENKDAMNLLLGMLGLIQAGIVKFYFDGTKSLERSQLAGVRSRAASEATIQEIAKAVPAVIAPIVPRNGKPIEAQNVDVKASGDVTVQGGDK